MFIYNLVSTLTVLFGVTLLISFVLFILSGGDAPVYGLVILVAGVLLFASMYGEAKIAENNTTTETEIVQMEVNKCDITQGEYKTEYHITVGNKHIIRVTAEEYAEINVGDMVEIEVVTKTVFGEAKKPNISLKG